MSITRTVVLDSPVDEDIEHIRWQMQKMFHRPVTKIEVTQEAIKIGVKVLMKTYD